MQDTIFTPEHLIMQSILTKKNKSGAEQQNSQIITTVKEWKGQISLLWLWIGDRTSIWIQQREKIKCTPNLRKNSWQQGSAAGCGMSAKACNWVLAARKYIRGNHAGSQLSAQEAHLLCSNGQLFNWIFLSLLHVSSSHLPLCRC